MSRRGLVLCTPLLASPLAWAVSLLANFALAPQGCAWQGKLAIHIVSFSAMAVTAASSILAWSSWQRERGTGALAGLVLSAAFFLVIVAQSLPNFLLAGCE
jgi:hypothetical protein